MALARGGGAVELSAREEAERQLDDFIRDRMAETYLALVPCLWCGVLPAEHDDAACKAKEPPLFGLTPVNEAVKAGTWNGPVARSSHVPPGRS